MSRKNKDVFSEIIVGIFMLAVLALLAYFTIVISGVDLLMGRAKTTATFVFRDVGGLKERDSVMYRGMKVGAVERIELGASNITVRVKVDSDVTMRETGWRPSPPSRSLAATTCCWRRERASRFRWTRPCFAASRPWTGCATWARSRAI